MSKRRLVVVGVVVLAVVVGVWQWRRGGEPTSTTSAATPAGGQSAVAPAAGDAPRWVGQSGVGGRRIAGTVIGENGAPIAGANVRLSSPATTAGLSKAAVVVTDATGRFDFGGRAAAEYVVLAEAPHLTGAVDRVDMRDPLLTPPPDQLRLILHACETSIHGTVRDSAGGVVPGARISRDQLTTSGGAESDAAGNYELCVPAGGSRVWVSGDGYAVVADNINVFGRTRRDFELAPGASVGGRVVRADDKSPVVGAIVDVLPEDWQTGGTMLTASSDAEGRFHIDGITPGRLVMTARADHLATLAPVNVIAEVGRPSDDVVCEVAATATVSGKVVLRGGTTPVPGATVYLNAAMAMGRATRPGSAITQGDGTFTIDRVLPGEYRPMVLPMMRRRSFDGEPLPKVKVEATDVTGLVLAVEQGASISGRILHDGKPVDGASVMIESGAARAESNQDGSYTLRGLDEGTYQVYAESHRVGAFARGAPVTISKGEERKGVDVELTLSGSIAGIVVDGNDAPVAGAFLSFSLLHGRDFGSATTADDGTFTARSLSGGGDYVYQVRQRDGSPLVFPSADGKRFAPITVADGGTHVTGVRIKVKVERLSISGRVTDTANQPVADVVVRAAPSEAFRYWGGTTATSDQTGAFTIRDLPPGTYRLQASAARGDGSVDNISAGQTNVPVRLVALGGIEGTVDGLTGVEIMASRLDERTRPYRAIVTGATFAIRNLPAGDYRIVATSTTGAEYSRASVPPGGTAKVTIRRHEVGIIEGTIVDSKTRAPVPGVRCMSGIETDDFGGSMSSQGMTDARGAFRLERAPVGNNSIMCSGGASGKAVVTAGQVTHVELTGEAPSSADSPPAQAGMELEQQLGDVMVESVTPGGPAARAGVQRGDVVLKIDALDVKQYGVNAARRAINDHALDAPMKVTLERGDKQVTVSVTLEPKT